ncbi:unnamed protein product [Ostreobium quekettii]|uniref:nitric-oxide synthase (NADPH) n=1 Tax=Ostreobium quekettii TaxID=121088 RepID=A0A8S1IRP3_9CHLO|nr:unnamed protein product [Ostreobium quekettii]
MRLQAGESGGLWRWAKKKMSKGGRAGDGPTAREIGPLSPRGGEFVSSFGTDKDRACSGSSRCPLGHGSVGVDPYPGYVHGRCPSICKYGCQPKKRLGAGETPRQTLIREAVEYQELYHREAGSTPKVKEARIAQVLAEIQTKGTYDLTFDELQHGARVAWRNAPKCSNRGHWSELVLLDYRAAATNGEMFKCCLEYLETAIRTRATVPYIAAFRPARPGSLLGPRIWNGQLHKFCAYMTDEGRVMGDPAELAFTEFLETGLGWKAPKKRGEFDIQPLVLQMDPREPPEVFEIPPSYVEVVNIQHPENEGFQALGLKWVAIPFVSDIELSVGGITFTAAPFNGWFADTEIVRDLADEGRYNKLPAIAEAFGLDTKTNGSMWRDGAMYELCRAVFHSFGEAKVGLIDHHTLLQNFYEWYHTELATRGYSPGNWKWIISPMSSSTSPCYLGLNKMIEYTLKPAYTRAPGWVKYCGWLNKPLRGDRQVVNLFANWALIRVLGRMKGKVNALRPSLAILYASVSGNTRRYAHRMKQMLKDFMTVELVNMADFDPKRQGLESALAWVFMTSTYGCGALPQAAKPLLSWLSEKASQEKMHEKPFTVIGFGDTSYPRFCAAADSVMALVMQRGGRNIVPLAKADAISGEEDTFLTWVKQVVQWYMSNTKVSHTAIKELLPYAMDDDVIVLKAPHVPFRVVKWVQTADNAPEPVPRANMTAGRWKRHRAKVVDTTEVSGHGDTARSTNLIKLDISQFEFLKYSAGDYVQIFPRSKRSPELLEFANNLGIDDLDGVFDIECLDGSPPKFPVPIKFVTALTEHLDVHAKITAEVLQTLSCLSGLGDKSGGEDCLLLQELATDPEMAAKWLAESHARWIDLFECFPSLVGNLPIAACFHLLPIMRPRAYSVASSHRFLEGREVHCLVQRLHYTLPNARERSGLCSNYVGDTAIGDTVAFNLNNAPHFRLPINPEAPILMVGAGTGVAPFRGFIQERAYLKRYGPLGPAILIHGCRSRGELVFEQELNDGLDSGVLTDFYVAYSREFGLPKAHVQDIILANQGRLRVYLQNHAANVYLCGSVKLSIAVTEALQQVMDKPAFARMVEDGRYHEDVFSVDGNI